MKKALLLFGIFYVSLGYSQTYITINDGFWSDPNVWQDGVTPNENNYDTIIINNLIELDQDLYFDVGVFIVTDSGYICSNFYSLNFDYYVTIINDGHIAVRRVVVGPGSEFHNEGIVRTEGFELGHSKQDPDGELYGDNPYVVTELDDACPEIDPSDPDSLSEVVKESIQIKEEYIEICEGETPEFEYSKARYIWENGAINSDFKPTESKLYRVQIVSKIDTSGPRNNDSVYVKVIPSGTSIPNIFTPNNDLINDEFLPDNFELKELSIYNRWGKSVLFSESPINNYDELVDGTYFFVITHENECIEENPLKGWVQISR